MNKKLSPRQTKFVDSYLTNSNATKSAELAGYSPKTAYSQGQRLLKKVEIKEILNMRQLEAADKADISLEWTLREVHELAKDAKKDSDKLKALDMLMKHTGGYEADNTSSKNQVLIIIK